MNKAVAYLGRGPSSQAAGVMDFAHDAGHAYSYRVISDDRS
jgi:hypothetical protein